MTEMFDRVIDWLVAGGRLDRVDVIEGRARRCASQEGNALYVAVTLNAVDEGRQLAQCLIDWQWPDGGWNCDRRPSASHSSFHETVWPLRALATYGVAVRDTAAIDAVQRASAFLLRHRLFRSERTGEVIDERWLRIHWPPYWHYDVLGGLRVLRAVGMLDDARVADALELLESKQLPDGRFQANRSWWQAPTRATSAVDVIYWGKNRPSEALTLQALVVRQAAGRQVGAD